MTALDPNIKVETMTKAQADSLAKTQLAEAEIQHKETVKKIKKAKLVEVSLAPMYAPYFGDIMTVSINGVSIYFPCNGRRYKVPEPFAALIHERRRKVDDHEMRRDMLSNVSENVEQVPGARELIPR